MGSSGVGTAVLGYREIPVDLALWVGVLANVAVAVEGGRRKGATGVNQASVKPSDLGGLGGVRHQVPSFVHHGRREREGGMNQTNQLCHCSTERRKNKKYALSLICVVAVQFAGEAISLGFSSLLIFKAWVRKIRVF